MKRIDDFLHRPEWRLFQVIFWTWALARDWHLFLVPRPLMAVFIAANIEGVLINRDKPCKKRVAESVDEGATP